MSRRTEIVGAEVVLHRDVFDDAATLFDRLIEDVPWRRETIRMFGRTVAAPRLTAWYGESAYAYSGIVHEPRPWAGPVVDIKARTEDFLGESFNGVLLNRYRNGSDGMGWHSDDEPELGPRPVIASVSFGATRRFALRRKADKRDKICIDLPSGSVLYMGGESQSEWRHCVPKTRAEVGERINLTFRIISPG